MSTVLIKQPAGLGDIIFCLKIACHYIKQGHNVIWPVIKEYKNIKDYIRIEGLTFYCEDDFFPYKYLYESTPVEVSVIDGVTIVPLQSAWNKYKEGRIMDSKYRLVGIDWHDWINYFDFKRNHKKENELYNIFELQESEPYIFWSRKFASPPDTQVKDLGIVYGGNKRIIELEYIEDYSLFDWSKIIENASEIYMVDSGLNYIIEKLELKTNKLHLHPRWGVVTEFELSGIFKTPWILCGLEKQND